MKADEVDRPFLRATRELGGVIDREVAIAVEEENEGDLAIALIDAERAVDAYPRLPRILGSVSSSGSLLLAAASLRGALRDTEEFGWESLAIPLGIISVGIFGTVFCLALQRELIRARKQARDAINRLAGL